jgi:hypothetical protein
VSCASALINICSLSWSDIEAAGLMDHPLWKHFDIVFKNFIRQVFKQVAIGAGWLIQVGMRQLAAAGAQQTHRRISISSSKTLTQRPPTADLRRCVCCAPAAASCRIPTCISQVFEDDIEMLPQRVVHQPGGFNIRPGERADIDHQPPTSANLTNWLNGFYAAEQKRKTPFPDQLPADAQPLVHQPGGFNIRPGERADIDHQQVKRLRIRRQLVQPGQQRYSAADRTADLGQPHQLAERFLCRRAEAQETVQPVGEVGRGRRFGLRRNIAAGRAGRGASGSQWLRVTVFVSAMVVWQAVSPLLPAFTIWPAGQPSRRQTR